MALKMGGTLNFLLCQGLGTTPTRNFINPPMKIHCKSSKDQALTKKLPPGPMKLPLIGNLHSLIGSLPHHALKDLAKEHGPLMHLQLGEISAVVVSSSEMAREVMKTHDANFAQRPELIAPKVLSYDLTDIAFSPYGDYWKQMRKICITELLGSKRVQSFASLREEEVSNLVESVRSSVGSPIDFTEMVFALTSLITCRAAFGNKCEDRDTWISLTKEAIALTGGFDLADLFPSLEFLQVIGGIKAQLEKIRKEADKILDRIIKERVDERMRKSSEGNGEPTDEDLIDVLLRVQGSGSLECPITINNIKAVIWDVFAAGTDTSSTTVDWAMAEMMRNPRILKKAQAEVREALKGKTTIREADIQDLSYLKLVIKETLRLHPPAPLLLPRESKEACEIGPYHIPKKTKVIVNAWAVMTDTECWPNAEEYIPERFSDGDDSINDYKGVSFEYIPFGAGRRICPGVSFGLANVELPLAQLLYFFDWELPFGVTPEDLDMTETFGATVGRKNHLFLIPKLAQYI